MSSSLSTLPPLSSKPVLLNFAENLFADMQAIDEAIARSAYDLFEARGSQPGFALNDWLKAEGAMLEPLSVSVEDAGRKLKSPPLFRASPRETCEFM